ncbi:hypothetical protein SEA_TAYLORSIPHT_11 [Arthrobacter phage TaylorSipht]|nr:hypothetical protein SEA_TAYLORSIPHT_11 [Arthrobacter phage TaylorSipht]
MGAKATRIVFKTKGFRAILRSKRVMDDLDRRGRAIAAAAGEGVGLQHNYGRARARVTVLTETRDARRAEATDKTLTRAIGAGRG